eukprot:5500311-Pyramimonas_sp.AAC.1
MPEHASLNSSSSPSSSTSSSSSVAILAQDYGFGGFRAHGVQGCCYTAAGKAILPGIPLSLPSLGDLGALAQTSLRSLI